MARFCGTLGVPFAFTLVDKLDHYKNGLKAYPKE
ncbi:hypothetical protein CCACVL1_15033 [Corchorus capsularis]|uniref:Uncharacterized protein n=1 Tax=Corchorus capsularis TaxID=210143 RepID=A0A1R3I446_COCAP|nr:hypothetical protein CCACVL1_15033 [Corchorus capsularis]